MFENWRTLRQQEFKVARSWREGVSRKNPIFSTTFLLKAFADSQIDT